MKKKTLHPIPVDLAVLTYLLVTALYMMPGFNKLQDVASHFLFRAGATIIIFLFAYYDNKNIAQNKYYRFIRNFYPLLLLSYFYKETGYLNNILFDYFDPFFAKAEQLLWGMQPAIEFSKHFPQKWFSELMNFGYFFYYLITFGLSYTLYILKPQKAEKVIFVIVTSFIIYYLIFILFPVKGPQFYFPVNDAQTVDSYFFSKLVKMAQHIGETETGAFPSSHVGMSVIFLILSYKYLRKAFWIILLPVILLWFATVYIKAHYLIDVLGGFVSAPLIYFITVKLYARINNHK
jgi:membrane-associated phospholipid phosphatase